MKQPSFFIAILIGFVMSFLNSNKAYSQAGYDVVVQNNAWEFCGHPQIINLSPRTDTTILSIQTIDSVVMNANMPDTIHTGCRNYRVELFSNISGSFWFDTVQVCINDCIQYCDTSVTYDASNHEVKSGFFSPPNGTYGQNYHQCSGQYSNLGNSNHNNVIIDSLATANLVGTLGENVVLLPGSSTTLQNVHATELLISTNSTASVDGCSYCTIYVDSGAVLSMGNMSFSKIFAHDSATIIPTDTTYYPSNYNYIWWSGHIDSVLTIGTGPNDSLCPNMDPPFWHTKCGNVDIAVNNLNPNPCCLQDVDIVYAPTCSGTQTSVSTTSNTGTIPFTYVWSNGQTTGLSQYLPSASNTVTVTDTRGCSVVDTFDVTSVPNNMSYSLQSYVVCSGSNGDITISGSGNTAPYTYAWSNGQIGPTNSNVTSGTYGVTITDALGCSLDTTVTVNAATNQPLIIYPHNTFCREDSVRQLFVSAYGEYPYSYQWSSGSTTQYSDMIPQGTYSVTVTDAAGCVVDSTFITRTDTAQLWIVGDSVLCSGGSNYSLTIGGNNGTTLHGFQWSTGYGGYGVLYSAIGIGAPGNYSCTVTGDYGCQYIDTIAVVQDIYANSIIGPTYVCAGDSITLAAPYGATNYQWSTGSTDSTVTISQGGNVSLYMSNHSQCAYHPETSTSITQRSNPIVNVNNSDIFCEGDTINMLAWASNTSSVAPPFTYEWDGPNGFTDTGSNVTTIDTGIYNVTITDSYGCSNSTSHDYQYHIISAGITATDTLFCSNQSSTLTSQLSGGVPTTYLWSNTGSDSSITITAPGNYEVIVTDQYGCKDTANIMVDTLETPFIGLTVTQPNCSGQYADVVLNTNAPSFVWSDFSTDSVRSIPASPNAYTVTVTGANGCSRDSSIVITAPSAFSATQSSTNSCHTEGTGTASITVTGATAPYSYIWSNGDTTSTADSLSAGNVYLTVTDANGCTTTGFNVVGQHNWLANNYYVSNAQCTTHNGSVLLNHLPHSNHTYVWNNGVNNYYINNLASGTYVVTVTNNGTGCQQVDSFVVQHDNASIIANTTSINADCYGNSTGTLFLTTYTSPYGGSLVGNQDWRDASGTQVGTSFSVYNQPAGIYTLSLTDSKGCTSLDTVVINQPDSFIITTSSYPALCNGTQGSAVVNVTGGTYPYGYQWTGHYANTGLQDSVKALAGTIQVSVTDVNGCGSGVYTITVTQPDSLLSLISVDSVNCHGDSDGSAVIASSGGTAPYSYVWNNTATTDSLGGLVAGTYTVTTTDMNGCTVVTSNTIHQPNQLSTTTTSTNISCNGSSDGSGVITTVGGTLPYNYMWSNNSSTSNIDSLMPGTYTVTIVDGNSCHTIDSISITQPDTLVANTLNYLNPSCYGGSNGYATVTAQGGTSPYTYVWNNGQSSAQAIALTAGIYNVTVTDGNGCTDSVVSITLNQPDSIEITITSFDVSCHGSMDGSIDVYAQGGTSPYIATWNNSTTSFSLVGVDTGTYTVTITDTLGCTQTATAGISQPDSFYVTGVLSDSASFANGTGSITSVIHNGFHPYTFNWNNGGSSDTLQNLSYGTYHVTVTDSNGCITMQTFTITDNSTINVNKVQNDALNINVYPNPTNGLVNINFENTNVTKIVEVYNNLGQKILEKETIENTISFDMGNTPAGTYYCKVTVGRKVQTIKLIKSR